MSRFVLGLLLQILATSQATFSQQEMVYWNYTDTGMPTSVQCTDKGTVEAVLTDGTYKVRFGGQLYDMQANQLVKATCAGWCCPSDMAKKNLDSEAKGTRSESNALCCAPTCKSFDLARLNAKSSTKCYHEKYLNFFGRKSDSDSFGLANDSLAAFGEACCVDRHETCGEAIKRSTIRKPCPPNKPTVKPGTANMSCNSTYCKMYDLGWREGKNEHEYPDIDICCYKEAPPGSCADHTCPAGYRMDRDPQYARTCKGEVCDISSVNATDFSTCCVACEECRANQANPKCVGTGNEKGKCQGMCGSAGGKEKGGNASDMTPVACPEGYKAKAGSEKNLCTLGDCEVKTRAMDTSACCEKCGAEDPSPECATTTTTPASTSTAASSSQGSSSSGASSSATNAPSTGKKKETTVEGAMKMDLTLTGGQDLATFVKDDKVRQGISQGIATRLEVVAPDTVTIKDISIVSDRRLASRRLTDGKIKVDYLVSLYGMKPLEDFRVLNGIEARLGNAQIYQEEMAAAVKKAVEATTGKTLDVVVAELGDITIIKGTGESVSGSSGGSSGGASGGGNDASSADGPVSRLSALWMAIAVGVASSW